MKNSPTRKLVVWIINVTLILTQTLQTASAVTVLADKPLAHSTATPVRPNIMYVLDNSGSMGWDYTPDYINDAASKLDPTGAPTTPTWGMCWGVSGTGGTGGSPLDTDKAVQCTRSTQIPYATAAVNYQFYDPTIRYRPPLHADGSTYPNSVATAAPSDGFNAGSSTRDLTNAWTHQVWCDSSTATPTALDPTAGGKCSENSDTSNDNLLPDAIRVYLKTYNASPYYFVMSPSEYCTDNTLTNCVRSSAATTVGSVIFNTPSVYRWCNSYSTASHTFSGCQGRRDLDHVIPNYLGGWAATGSTGSFARAGLTIKSFTDGQSITGLSVFGTQLLTAPITPENGATTTKVAQQVCAAIQATSASTGYDCPTPPTSPTLTVQAGKLGEAANGQEVLVTGPADSSALYSLGKVVILDKPSADDQIAGVTINGNALISVPITSDGNTANTAKMLCEAINAGPKKDIYSARMPKSSPPGTCDASSGTELGEVWIERKIADTTDNGQDFVVTGPPAATVNTATITVNTPNGDTRIDDILVGGTSILGSKPMLFTSSTPEQIATSIQSNITGLGCTASVIGNVITLHGNGTTCAGAISVQASTTAATAKFRVASTGSTNAADLGNIQVASNQSPSVVKVIVTRLTTAQLTNGTAVATNAATIQARLNSLSATTGFSAAAPVASTDIAGTYEITVTAPGGNIYNAQSFTFSDGTANAGGATGGSPQWQFKVTNATEDDRVISYIRCNDGPGDSPIYAQTTDASTGNSSDPRNIYTANLASGLNANGINGFSYICTHEGGTFNNEICTVTGPTGASACTGDLTRSYSSDITIDNYSKTSNGCPATTPSIYRFAIGSTKDGSTDTTSRRINSITCTGADGAKQDVVAPNTVATGTSSLSVTRRNNLSSGMTSNLRNGYTFACLNSTLASGQLVCDVTAPAGANCPTLSIDADAFIQVVSNTRIQGCSPATSASWTFRIEDATDNNELINSITCGGVNTIPPNTVSTGSAPPANVTRINNLVTQLQANDANGFTINCTAATATTPESTCTVVGPSGPTACTLTDADCPAKSLRIAHSTSISLAGGNAADDASDFPRGRYCVPLTSDGTSAGAATDNFAPALSNISPFSGGYAAQSTSVDPFQTKTFGTIATATVPMSDGSPVSPRTIPTNATGSAPDILVLSGGTAPAAAKSWVDVGVFKRVDVTPANSSYPRAPGRTDCAAATCNYTEELQNFANWYTYYRTRMQMMKTTSTLAFNALDGKYRVGFDDICNCSSGSCATTVKQGVAQFVDTDGEVTNQRTNWWNQLTGSTPSCATPLRAETAKIGRYFAGRLSGADPIQYSCQQNFMLLVTDGYWNETDSAAIKDAQPTGVDIANRDNNEASAPRPFYDGQMTNTTCPDVGSNRGSTASSCRTMADIAWYYYTTDLRSTALGNSTNRESGVDVSDNNVPFTSDDPSQQQHMSFYAMGLGVDGTLVYRPDYALAGSGDYAEIVSGTRNWPAVKNLDPTGVDDLWHAAVNGRGKYFSARNPTSVVAGLSEALNRIGQKVGAASAAATSNLEPVSGDNFVYVANYETGVWTGDLQAREINLVSGAVSTTPIWSAGPLLEKIPFATRRIYMAPTSGAPGDPPRLFDYDNLTLAERAKLHPGGNPVNSTDPEVGKLSQWDDLKVTAAADITTRNLVDFLRGDRSLESDGSIAHTQVWRHRARVLGDIVDTQPVFVKSPAFTYLDTGYSNFRTTGVGASRKPVVYVSAQDGMLHAFNADTANVTVGGVAVKPGEEMWAYVPSEILPVMKKLADKNYAHRYFVDGPITVGDVNFGGGTTDWHTILVAGLGAGGKSYFALDITDPLQPKFLWEFTDANLGFTLGNSTINKLPNGEWAVFFSSGYNNSDGRGYLYALNPQTGAIKTGFPLSTGSGGTASTVPPGSESNLGKIAVWVNEPTTNNTAEFIYGGDVDGNLWRFDLAPNTAGHTPTSVFQLARLTDSNGKGQPITTRPELTRLEDGTHVVYVGTGQYLGLPDIEPTTDVQSFYAIKDTLGAPNRGGVGQVTWTPRTDLVVADPPLDPPQRSFQQRVLISEANDGSPLTLDVGGVSIPIRQACSGPDAQVDAVTQECINETGVRKMGAAEWAMYGGWFYDFPEAGERMNVDMNLTLGTLTVASNVPGSTSCTPGGHSFFNSIDYNSGLAVPNTSKAVSRRIGTSLIVGLNVVKLPGGTLSAIATTADNQQLNLPPSFSPSSFGNRRSLWREFEAF